MKNMRNVLERKPTDVATVPSGTRIREAARVMADLKIGSILVTDKKKLVGIVTERDMLNRVVSAGVDPDEAPVDQIMSRDLITCSPEDSIEEVSRIITTARRRHIPITDNGHLVGIVTAGDIMATVLEERTIEVTHLKNYIQGNITT